MGFPRKYCFCSLLHFTTKVLELELCAATNSGALNGAKKTKQKDGKENRSLRTLSNKELSREYPVYEMIC